MPGGGGGGMQALPSRIWAHASRPVTPGFSRSACRKLMFRRDLDYCHVARSLMPRKQHWTVAESATLYSIKDWGAPYFDSSDAKDGRIVVRPLGHNGADDDVDIDLFALAVAVRERLGSGGPVLLRFPDIACSQAERLHTTFQEATVSWDYNASFCGVFPVKCCHDADVLLSLVSAGTKRGFGLEAGSKAELLLCIAILRRAQSSFCAEGTDNSAEGSERIKPLMVCNGYKDEDFVRLAVASSSLYVTTIIVLEKPSELPKVLFHLKQIPPNSPRPVLGIRVRLATTYEGQWGATSGDDSKFGLGAREILSAMHFLVDEGMLDCLRLLHFHIGSQVSKISTIKEAMREASQMYAELVRLGAPMGYIDVGGGLGVDYNGTQGWGGHLSTNYDMQNYANDVIAALKDMCTRTGTPPPIVVSESGRAIASASATLIFEVISTEPRGARDSRKDLPISQSIYNADWIANHSMKGPTIHELRTMPPSLFLLHNFREVLVNMSSHSATTIQESLNDALQFRQEADRLFKLGIMGLEDRAEVEDIYSCVRESAFSVARQNLQPRMPPMDVQSAAKQPAAWYHANMSVFRSLPDSWAIGQLFPIAPLHRLSEQPEVAGSIADLTCDSDGRVDNFIPAASQIVDRGKPTTYLPLHQLREDEDYLIAAFLVGAYQESMGSCGHNLYGCPAVATVHTSTNCKRCVDGISFKFDGADVVVRAGQTTAEVLKNVGVHPENLMSWINDWHPPGDSVDSVLLETYKGMLKSLTYLESDR